MESKLLTTLEEVEAWFRNERPELLGRFRPGLIHDEIRALEVQLAPYYLPHELETLYQWRDGWQAVSGGSHVLLLHDGYFHSLADAIERYHGWCEMLYEDIWNPLWFPAFGEAHGEFMELQAEPGQVAGGLWGYDSHDGAVELNYDSVASLFSASLELWRTGKLPLKPDAYEYPREVLARHNPRTRDADGNARHGQRYFPSLGWPDQWKEAVGVGPFLPAPDSELVTVAELLSDPLCGRPVRCHLQGGLSRPGWSIDRITDETGSIQARLDRQRMENYAFRPWSVDGEDSFDVYLTPISDGHTDHQAVDAGDFRDEAEAARTTRDTERTYASFHATRIVPLT